MIKARSTDPNYRWVIVFASAAVLAVVMGMMVNGISVFFVPLNEEYNWNRASIAFINTSGLIGIALGGVIIGFLANKISIRKICIFGVLALGLCMIAASQAQQLWQFYSLFFIAGLIGAGAIFAPIIANVGNWFKTGAGLAVGIASAGQALGQGAVPFGSAFLISAYGWREALGIIGLIAIIGLVPLAYLITPAPIKPQTLSKSNEDDTSPVPLSTNTVILWLSAAVLFCCICMSVPLMHLVPLIQDRGFSPQEAGSVAFVMLAVAIMGRIAFGKLADILGPIPAYFTASLWQTVLVFYFVYIIELSNFYIFAVIFGFGYAGVMTGLLVCVHALTPLNKKTKALGIVLVFAWLGHGIGGYQGGLFYDLTGNYTQSYAVAAIAGFINLMIVATLYLKIHRAKRIALSRT